MALCVHFRIVVVIVGLSDATELDLQTNDGNTVCKDTQCLRSKRTCPEYSVDDGRVN